jgi:hypothetical protein
MLFSGTALDPAREAATESQKLKRNQDGNGDPASASRPYPGPAMTDFEPDTLVACEKPALYPEGFAELPRPSPLTLQVCVNDLLKRDMEPIDAPK